MEPRDFSNSFNTLSVQPDWLASIPLHRECGTLVSTGTSDPSVSTCQRCADTSIHMAYIPLPSSPLLTNSSPLSITYPLRRDCLSKPRYLSKSHRDIPFSDTGWALSLLPPAPMMSPSTAVEPSWATQAPWLWFKTSGSSVLPASPVLEGFSMVTTKESSLAF